MIILSASASILTTADAGDFLRAAFKDASARTHDPELADQYRDVLGHLQEQLGFRGWLCTVRYYGWGWTQEEIAPDLQVSKATIQRDLERARRLASEFIGRE